jgi:hypothetical protein
MQLMFLLKNSGNTRFDHGAHGAWDMICFSTVAQRLFTAGVRTWDFFRPSISELVFAFEYHA